MYEGISIMSTIEERKKKMWKNYNGHKGMTLKEQVEKLKEDKIRAQKDYEQKKTRGKIRILSHTWNSTRSL